MKHYNNVGLISMIILSILLGIVIILSILLGIVIEITIFNIFMI